MSTAAAALCLAVVVDIVPLDVVIALLMAALVVKSMMLWMWPL